MASLDLSLEVSRTESMSLSVAEVSGLRSGSFKKSKKGTLSRTGDAAWYVFDNLSCEQAEDLLRQHGDHGTYLVAHFHEPESYGLSIKLEEGGGAVFKHYAIGISNKLFHTEGIGEFSSIEEVVEAVEKRMRLKLVPIFHRYNQDTSDFEVTITEDDEDDEPPEYNQASRYPEAAKKPLPLIVPVYPTLRRMMRQQQQQQQQQNSAAIEESVGSEGAEPPHGCCWKAFHTDMEGKWYKPHKAGPVTAVLLVIGWIIFLLLFGWIVGLALLVVLLLISCACLYNYICTGRCSVEEEGEEEGEGDVERAGPAQQRGGRPGDGRQLGSPYRVISDAPNNRTS